MPSPALPTAMQLDGLVQDTPFSAAPALASFGVGTTVHLDPFQDSAIGLVAVVVFWVKLKPTAIQAVLLGHETESSSPPPWATFGVGLGTTVHAVPFQVSASVNSGPLLDRNVPTE